MKDVQYEVVNGVLYLDLIDDAIVAHPSSETACKGPAVMESRLNS